jgi:hypothetical protein
MNMRIVRIVCWLTLLAGIVVFSLDGANLTGAMAQGSPQEQQACTPDALRLCGDAIPDVPKVTACMKAKYSQLSEPCRVAMRGGGPTRASAGTSNRHVAREATHHYGRVRGPHCDPFTHVCS